MALQIILKAVGHIVALRHQLNAFRAASPDLIQKKRIMGAAENNRVNFRVETEQFIHVFPHKIVGAWRGKLLVLHQRHPHGAGNTRDLDIGKELVNLYLIGERADGARCGKKPHMARLRDITHALHRGADDAQHTARGVVHQRKVALLDAAQGLGGGCVTGQDDQRTTRIEEVVYGLQSEFVHHLIRAGAIRRTGVVTQIEIVVLGHQAANLLQDCQTAVSAVENSYRRRHGRKKFC